MKYHERRITYDEKTQNFKITVPELGLEVLSDTEMGALLEMRKEVIAAAKRPKLPPQPKMGGLGDFVGIDLPQYPPNFAGPVRGIGNGQSQARAGRMRECPRCGYPRARQPGCDHCGLPL